MAIAEDLAVDIRRVSPQRLRAVCTCGRCQSCGTRRAWAHGDFDNRRKGFMWDSWSPREIELLERLAGTMEIERVAEEITRVSDIPRTVAAVRVKATRLGISMWTQGMSMVGMERLFGLDHRAIERWWVDPGLLAGRRWNGRGPNEGWWFDPKEVEAFIRSYPWVYDWRDMKAGHPLTRLAEVINALDPWLHNEELARYVGINPHNLNRWRRRGLVPFKRRPKSGRAGYVMIRGRDFPGIKADIHEAQRAARRRGIDHSVATRRAKAGMPERS